MTLNQYAALNRPREMQPPATPSPATLSVADEIAKLAKLLEDEIITISEFESAKAGILRRVAGA